MKPRTGNLAVQLIATAILLKLYLSIYSRLRYHNNVDHYRCKEKTHNTSIDLTGAHLNAEAI